MSKAAPYIDTFLSGMDISGKTLYNQVIQKVKRLDTNDEASVIRTPYNISLVNDVAGVFDEFFDSPAYEARLQRLINAMATIGAEVTQLYTKKYGEIPEPVMQEAISIYDQYNYALSGTLDDDTIAVEVASPYINEMFFAMGIGSNLDSLLYDSRKIQNSLHAYFITKVTVLLEQYERSLNLLYSSYFDVKKFRYSGPKDKLNRDFCHVRAGRVYTEKEIQSWAMENWEGKLPGTDSLNIFVNAGGYNCRHIFEPI